MPSTSSFRVLLVFLCMLLVAIFLLPRLPVKIAPQRDLPTLTISFSMNTMTSRVLEMEVTSRLEGMLSRIKGIQSVSSSSDNGSGSVRVQLSKHAKLEVVRFEIANMIRQLYPSLPTGVSYPVLSARQSDDESAKPFLTYTLNAPASASQIQNYAENNIRAVLANLKGIDQVELYGASGQVWQLEYDSHRLKTYDLTVGDLQKAIQTSMSKTYLGMGQMGTSSNSSTSERNWIRLVLSSQPSGDSFDASSILVSNREGKVIRLDEVVKVSRGDAKPYSYYRINGLNSVYLTILARGEVNQLKLAKAVKQQLKELEAQFPPNYEMHLSYDATEYIQDQLKLLFFRSGLTILLLLVLILLIYRNLRYVLMICLSLLGSLSLAVVMYFFVGLEMHLYSLMGLTISLNLMLDNIIVMADQIHRQRNKRAFLAILASTMTTIAALVMVFFMEEKIKLNLQDFALVIVINLISSLLVVLFLVPSLMDSYSIGRFKAFHKTSSKKRQRRFRKRTLLWNRIYARYIRFASRHWALVLLAGILLFGLPVFMLPSAIGGETPSKIEKGYNSTIGSSFYQEKLKPIVDVVFGGTLRLFIQKVYQGSYWKKNEETSIYLSLSMPNGATLVQTDFLIEKMEKFLKKFDKIKQFQTKVNAQKASIDIRFSNDYQYGAFPYSLKNELISRAIELGGGSWGVYGLGDGFSNNLIESTGSNRLKMTGYNFDELYCWAERARDSLLRYHRIKEVTIDSKFSYHKDDYQEFVFDLKKSRLAEENLNPQTIFGELNTLFRSDGTVGSWVMQKGVEPILLSSRQAGEYDLWMLNQVQGQLGDRSYRIADLATIDRYQAPKSIVRENQQYVLCLQYEYIGSYGQAGIVMDNNVETFSSLLPVGYGIQKDGNQAWNDKGQSKQYWFLLVIICIIYFTTSILFNSLKQPLAILLIIPIAFVGLFLTFYSFKLNFDQGGFAAFVLLCGITVNAGIYVVNQYNQFKRKGIQSPLKAYLKAWNYRIIPVCLTVVATILGFIPFLIGEKEGFWYPMAAGTIGGLTFSMIGLIFFLPAFLLRKIPRSLPRGGSLIKRRKTLKRNEPTNNVPN